MANPVDSRGLKNPYQFKFSDKFMQKETAPNYYPPLMRKQMNEFMSKTSINLNFDDPSSVKLKKSKSKSRFDKAK